MWRHQRLRRLVRGSKNIKERAGAPSRSQQTGALPVNMPGRRQDETMQITVLHIDNCPNVNLVRRRLAVALAETGRDASVTDRLVSGHADATALGFVGSPTVRFDGVDPFAAADLTPSLACRLYPTRDGLQGAPSVEDLVDALRIADG